MLKTLFAVLALSALMPLAAHAEEEKEDCTKVSRAQWMSEDAIKTSVEKAGYTDIRSAEVKGSCYEIYAFKNGERTEIYVDPATGTIFPSEEND